MKRIIRTMNIKKYLYSEANIFHAIYSIKESIQEKNILDTNDKDDLLELFDVFNEDKIQKKIQEIRPMLKEYLEKDDKLFKAKVYFVPKSWDTSNNKAKYRPLHTASFLLYSLLSLDPVDQFFREIFIMYSVCIMSYPRFVDHAEQSHTPVASPS